MKTNAIFGALALVSLAGCSTLPNGDYAIGGQDLGAKNSALLAKYNVDLQNFVNSLPNACAQAKSAQGFTTASLITAQSIFTTLKPTTVASLNAIAGDVVKACNGLAVAAVPVAVAVSGQ